MKTNSSLTQAEFNGLLTWLDLDPDKAAQKYEEVRRRLIWFFLNRQCSVAEDLTDETINRVAKKPQEWKDNYEGEPMAYLHAVAKNVFREYCREVNRKVEPPAEPSDVELESRMICLRKCMAELTSDNRKLIIPYYQGRKRAKIESHKNMGNKLGLNPGALRARIHRIRTKLRDCVEKCLANQSQSNDISSVDI